VYNSNMTKAFRYILILVLLLGIFTPAINVAAQTPLPSHSTTCSAVDNKGNCLNDTTYTLLAPLPCDSSTTPGCVDGQLRTYDPNASENNIGSYLNLMIKIFIGICAVLAVIMIVMGGVEYMTSELVGNKEHGKNQITHAIFGLILALAAWTIINQINPDILKTDLKNLTTQTVEVDLNADVPQTYDPVTKKYPGGYTYGNPWDDTVAPLATLPYGVTVYNRQCTFLGDTGCTSTRGLDVKPVQAIQYGCKCALQISGGTESWLHGGKTGNTTHALGSGTVDLLPSTELNRYIAGDKPLTYFARYTNGIDGISYLWESNHWHAGP
jgi:hypothetical protein